MKKSKSLSVRGLFLSEKDGFTLSISNIEMEEGEVVGVIGSNGSGKTSLLEAILGFRSIQDGEIRILGTNPHKLSKGVRKKLGVYLQTTNYESTFLVKEIVQLHKSACSHTLIDLYELLSIAELEKKTFEHCSTGQRQRLGLYLSLAASPQLTILDEPTSALDALAATAFRNYLITYKQENPDYSGLLVTHNKLDIELVDRIVWLDNGKIVDVGTPNILIEKHLGIKRLTIYESPPEFQESILSQLDNSVKILSEENEIGDAIHLFGRRGFEADIIAHALNQANSSYSVSDTNCEDLVAYGLNRRKK